MSDHFCGYFMNIRNAEILKIRNRFMKLILIDTI